MWAVILAICNGIFKEDKIYLFSNKIFSVACKGNKILIAYLKDCSSLLVVGGSRSGLCSLKARGRIAKRAFFFPFPKSFWLHVKCRMEMSLSVFNFFFFLYGLWCSGEDPYWKKKLKTGNFNFVRLFTCNQIKLKLSDFLFHYCHLMMAVPLKILLFMCFARKKILSGLRHVLNISLNYRLYGPH